MNEQTTKQSTTTRLVKKSFLKMIENSIDSNMFRNFYLSSDGEEFDAMKDGELSCAFYVSSVLALFQLIERLHGTVKITEQDLVKSGWNIVDEPVLGSVIVWESGLDQNGKILNEHIGFYFGENSAISNSTANRKIAKHHWTYNDTRKIRAIYSHPVLFD